jgi:hypothetical protein
MDCKRVLGFKVVVVDAMWYWVGFTSYVESVYLPHRALRFRNQWSASQVVDKVADAENNDSVSIDAAVEMSREPLATAVGWMMIRTATTINLLVVRKMEQKAGARKIGKRSTHAVKGIKWG